MNLQLHLDERHDDRVYVTVCLSPETDEASVHGVAVELRSRTGEPLSARLMLPVSGPLPGPLALRTEIRARADLPLGARVHGTVWWDLGQLDATCPTDPGTSLEAYAYGAGIPLGLPNPSRGPHDLTDDERERMYRAFPWMARYCRPDDPEDQASRIIEEQPEDLARDIADSYGLSDEDRDFLKELLGEEDEPLGGAWTDDDDVPDGENEGADLGDVAN
ncbi:MAG: hypothetical protein EA397_16230 [Deltaproteobacteria bacterium]|nr:MAG: hypothetical protein EA397_16230 [Deltaproteobacteria bacterium]